MNECEIGWWGDFLHPVWTENRDQQDSTTLLNVYKNAWMDDVGGR